MNSNREIIDSLSDKNKKKQKTKNKKNNDKPNKPKQNNTKQNRSKLSPMQTEWIY